jgi:hypothetical protein
MGNAFTEVLMKSLSILSSTLLLLSFAAHGKGTDISGGGSGLMCLGNVELATALDLALQQNNDRDLPFDVLAKLNVAFDSTSIKVDLLDLVKGRVSRGQSPLSIDDERSVLESRGLSLQATSDAITTDALDRLSDKLPDLSRDLKNVASNMTWEVAKNGVGRIEKIRYDFNLPADCVVVPLAWQSYNTDTRETKILYDKRLVDRLSPFAKSALDIHERTLSLALRQGASRGYQVQDFVALTMSVDLERTSGSILAQKLPPQIDQGIVTVQINGVDAKTSSFKCADSMCVAKLADRKVIVLPVAGQNLKISADEEIWVRKRASSYAITMATLAKSQEVMSPKGLIPLKSGQKVIFDLNTGFTRGGQLANDVDVVIDFVSGQQTVRFMGNTELIFWSCPDRVTSYVAKGRPLQDTEFQIGERRLTFVGGGWFSKDGPRTVDFDIQSDSRSSDMCDRQDGTLKQVVTSGSLASEVEITLTGLTNTIAKGTQLSFSPSSGKLSMLHLPKDQRVSLQTMVIPLESKKQRQISLDGRTLQFVDTVFFDSKERFASGTVAQRTAVIMPHISDNIGDVIATYDIEAGTTLSANDLPEGLPELRRNVNPITGFYSLSKDAFNVNGTKVICKPGYRGLRIDVDSAATARLGFCQISKAVRIEDESGQIKDFAADEMLSLSTAGNFVQK